MERIKNMSRALFVALALCSAALLLAATACHDSQNNVVEPPPSPQHDRTEVLRALMGTPLDETTSTRLTSILGPVVITKLQPGQSWRDAPFPPRPDRIEALRALLGTTLDEVPATLSAALRLPVADGEELPDVLYQVFNVPVVITRLDPGQDWREVPLPSRADRIVDEGGFCGAPPLALLQQDDDAHPEPACEFYSGASDEEMDAWQECVEDASEEGDCYIELLTERIRNPQTGTIQNVIMGAHYHCEESID